MKKLIGISAIFALVFIATAVLNPSFLSAYNIQNLLRLTGLFGIVSMGVAFVIITGGIDLSVGSVVGLIGCLLPWLIMIQHWPVAAALAAVLAVSVLLGLFHGLLVTSMRLKPFIVTLCGMLFYRGISRWFTHDEVQGFGDTHNDLKQWALGRLPLGGLAIPIPFIVMAGLAAIAAIFLNRTVYGRYLLALGRNKEAASFSGINTDRMTIIAYVIGALLSGIGGVLFMLDTGSVQPSSQGDFYEVYAIAAAVLGGCSLRGGEGSILGVVIGTALIQLLSNSIELVGIASQLEYAIIGAVILAGAIADEMVHRYSKKRETRAVSNTPVAEKPAPAANVGA